MERREAPGPAEEFGKPLSVSMWVVSSRIQIGKPRHLVISSGLAEYTSPPV